VINDLTDLQDVNITTTPMTENFFGNFAASAESRLNQKIEEIAQSASNGGAVETTYLRFSGKNILKTNHSMFLTTILVGGKFFETLTSEQQDAFRKAAKVVAKLERQWSLDDAEKYEQEAVAKGVDIREITETERDKMREAAPDQYTFAYNTIPGSESLVNEIKKTK
jgi:TRAP-type C4-dicarboxylate transport system substrate-binding protein